MHTEGICGLQVHDVYVPGGLEKLRCILEPLFMEMPLSKHLLEGLKEEIVLYYQRHGRPVVYVYVPEQEVKHGVVQIVVMEGTVGQIDISGNCWFSSDMFEQFLHLGPGDAITADTLLTDVAWLNRNPFREVDVIFTPGCDPGSTNIEIVTCDRCPFQVYAGMDNTGTTPSGPLRYYVGATWGNALFLDQILTYQYTTAQDPKEFQSHTFHWTVPFKWKHILLAYGGYSTVKPDVPDFDSTGSYFQGSLRYVVPVCPSQFEYIQEVTFGFDYKNYNNNALFVGSEDFVFLDSVLNLTQFVLGYSFGCESCWQKFAFNADLYGSPGKLLSNQSNQRYDNFSPEARVKYLYGKATMGQTFYMPGEWSFSALGRLQISSQNLLPSERFGIGGYDTVRGYRERQFLADNALVLNAEFRTPPISLLSFLGADTCCDRLLFLVFFDYALAMLHDNAVPSNAPVVGEGPGKTEWFMGVGPGMRYTINRYLSARVDWGVRLHNAFDSGKARSRWYGGFVLSF